MLFLKFYNGQNEISDFIQPDTVLEKFNWNEYAGSSIEDVANFVKGWSDYELIVGSF